MSVPDIVPLGVRELERFVVLPRYLEFQQVAWDTLRLTLAQLPPELATAELNQESTFVYQVTGEHFQASLKAVQRDTAAVVVNLADIHLAWLPDGSYRAVAAFDIDPGGARQCILELPPGSRLVHASVEHLPALATRLGENRWQLGLGPEQLPGRVEVLYLGSTPGDRALRRFSAPRLVDLAVAQTLWTVYSQPRLGLAEPIDSLLSPAEQEMIRLESVAELVELPAEVVGEHLPEEIARWYASWRDRYWAKRASLRRELIADHRPTAQSEEGIAARRLDERIAKVDGRLGASPARSRMAFASDASSQFMARLGNQWLPQQYALGEPSGNLSLHYAEPLAEPRLGRWLAALSVLLVCGLAAWWLRTRTLPTVVPQAVACGVGAVWWMLLSPRRYRTGGNPDRRCSGAVAPCACRVSFGSPVAARIALGPSHQGFML